MTKPLLELSGADLAPNRLSDATLVLIDIQGEYKRGLALRDVEAATAQAAKLLERARVLASPVFHVRHLGAPGGLFDPAGPGGAFLEAVTPKSGEAVVGKRMPCAFHETDLLERLRAAGRNRLIIAGFMTHMCVSTTTRRALDFGFQNTVVADACATRDLADGRGGVVNARDLHRASLTALSDRFAVIAQGADDIPD